MKKANTRKVLVPKYLTQFKCIGSDCEDTCCAGFSYMDVDKKTYREYQKEKDPELKKIIKTHISLHSAETRNEVNYAKIQVTEESRCPFLTENQLCSIQLKNGEKSLSTLCATFPRISNMINGKWEKSAVMSCPEAARLALLYEQGIEFIEVEEPTDSPHLYKAIWDTKNPLFPHPPSQFLHELRDFSIRILKSREYSLWERLLILGFFIQKAGKLLEGNEPQHIPNFFLSFSQLMSEPALKKTLEGLPVSIDTQFSLLFSLIGRSWSEGNGNKRYEDCVNEFLKGITHNSTSTTDQLVKNYEQAFQDHYLPFINYHDYILKNYLVNYVFRNVFPALTKRPLFDEYMILVVHYSSIKMHLIGMAGYHKQLTQELVIKLIQSYAKVVEHNHDYVEKVHQFMKEKNLNSMAVMSLLIRN